MPPSSSPSRGPKFNPSLPANERQDCDAGRYISSLCRQLLHTRQRPQRHFDTTVLCPSLGRCVARHRLIRPHATGAQATWINALRQEVVGYTLCPALRQVHVVSVRPRAVGMTDDLDTVLVVLAKRVGQVVQRQIEAAGYLCGVGSESDFRRA